MRKNSISQSGVFNPRVLLAFALCSVGAFLALLSLAANPPSGVTRSGANPPVDSSLVDKHAGPLSGNAVAATAGTSGPSGSPSVLATGRYYHTATLLPTGKVLVTAGIDSNNNSVASSELYDPATGTWTTTGSLGAARYLHTATLLPNGKVLVAGGINTGGASVGTELYDPAAGTWTTTRNLAMPRNRHTATLLSNGKVLVAGGVDTSGNAIATAELYDPTAGTWTTTGSLVTGRGGHTSTLLPNGKVLVAGGYNSTTVIPTAEVYDPAGNGGVGSWTLTAPLNTARYNHTATLLPNGKVLVAGGLAGGIGGGPISSAELYDPAGLAGVGSWTTIASLNTARYFHSATLLPDGKVLVAGGVGTSGALANVELFDPAGAAGLGSWTATGNLAVARAAHTATLLINGQTLITAGFDTSNHPVASAEMYDAAVGIFASLSPNAMTSPRASPKATLLPSGKVLLAGGFTGTVVTNSAELFDPTSGTFASLPAMTSARRSHSATLPANGKVLIAGGDDNNLNTNNTAELFDPTSGTFTSLSPNTMSSAHSDHTATLLPSGRVLIAGGYTTPLSGGPPTKTAELFDSATGTFTSLSPMTSARRGHTATLLPTGKVLIAGGDDGSGPPYTNTAELFDPVTGTFTSLSLMTSARYRHTATLLPTGKVLIAGGFFTNTAELFDLATGKFTSLSPNTMSSVRYDHTATLLQSGKVLVAGGHNASGYTDTAELFDPATESFTSLSPNTMTSVRIYHTATLLTTGKVLLCGGFDVNSSTMNTAELFDVGLGFADVRRPVISTVPNSVTQPASLVLTGTSFRGDSEASGSSFNSSATNYPILQLQRIDNEQLFFLLSDPQTNWSDTAFTSQTLGVTTPLPTGQYRVTIFTNAIPSFQKIINISAPSPVQLVSAVSRKTHGSAGTFDINLPLIGTRGVECRSGGTNSNYTMVFTFLNPVTNCGSASTGSLSSGPNPNQCTVNLTGVPNAQYITVTLKDC